MSIPLSVRVGSVMSGETDLCLFGIADFLFRARRRNILPFGVSRAGFLRNARNTRGDHEEEVEKKQIKEIVLYIIFIYGDIISIWYVIVFQYFLNEKPSLISFVCSF